MNYAIEFDGVHCEWICRIGGPGNPVVVAATKEALEQQLDYLDQYLQDVAQERQDVVFSKEAGSVNQDRRRCGGDCEKSPRQSSTDSHRCTNEHSCRQDGTRA
jgi:hypothetical protein